MNISEAIEAFQEGSSFTESISNMVKMVGIAALVLILIAGLIFFIPTIIASMRHIKLRVLVCIMNVAAILAFFVNIVVPVIIWLIIMIMAFVGEREQNKNKIPEIYIGTDQNKIKRN